MKNTRTLRSRARTALTGCGLAAVVGGLGVAAPATVTADVINCETGHVCIIDPNPEPLGTVDQDWYYYGTYNLSHELTKKYVCNQQTGGALVRLYSGYGASGRVLRTLRPNGGGHGNGCVLIDLRPVNSVKLSPN